jgi:hypothetical protein
MTWIKFAIWLCGIYFIYYAALILWDLIRSGRQPASSETHELTFIEHHEPIRPELERVSEFHGSAIMSSGGVSLKQMFNLAREEAIEFTRVVSF